MNLVFFLYIVLFPLCTLLHELGHSIAVTTMSKSHAKIYLGNKNKSKLNFKIGRVHFSLNLSLNGYCSWENSLSNRQKLFALIGGPLMSLLLALAFGGISTLTASNTLTAFLIGIMLYNLIQFLITIIPIRYPKWISGYDSDGSKILRLLKSNKKSWRV
ncbi:hypothetical protein [Alkalibacillus haloalkaliphilus]|uniref:hypothetical protein n=1 Tax=Alkalibacillus haloalkaliphilus TaxID=94136 RepID=UPI00035F6DB6|nr:hypothetical protein [Alkalibacillus haloalkaliphilus]